MAARKGSGAGHWKQALFLINTDTVAAFLGESKQRGTIGTLFVHGSHWGRPWPWGFVAHDENRLLTPSFLPHSPVSPSLAWPSPAARTRLGTAFPGQSPQHQLRC